MTREALDIIIRPLLTEKLTDPSQHHGAGSRQTIPFVWQMN